MSEMAVVVVNGTGIGRVSERVVQEALRRPFGL